MEKQMDMKEMKSVNVQCVVAGIVVLFCVMATIFGYESLGFSGVLIFCFCSSFYFLALPAPELQVIR